MTTPTRMITSMITTTTTMITGVAVVPSLSGSVVGCAVCVCVVVALVVIAVACHKMSRTCFSLSLIQNQEEHIKPKKILAKIELDSKLPY